MGTPAKQLAGQRFGMIVVTDRKVRSPYGKMWLFVCKCDCGGEVNATAHVLIHGRTKSCGCMRAKRNKEIGERTKTHGAARVGQHTPEYAAWEGIKRRCTIPGLPGWENYGGRGITICDRWRYSFENFLADVGPRPSPDHSIDRYPNNDGNYEPGNVRWATKKEQARNRRSTAFVEYQGKRISVAELAEQCGIQYTTLRHRIKIAGWSVDKAVQTPVS